jgi:hypothetical protein
VSPKGERAGLLLAAAGERGVPLAALGGVAIERLCPSARPGGRWARELADIDVATTLKAKPEADRVITGQGFIPDEDFNRVNGSVRLRYADADGSHLDVFVDELRLCHVVDWKRELAAGQDTLPLPALLLTKLQIVALNAKDRSDAYAVLLEHEVGPGDAERIDAERISVLCARDWGLYRTLQINYERLLAGLPESGLDEADQQLIAARVQAISAATEAAPKSVKWKARARVGDRVRWYEEPDEVDPGGY